MQFSLQSTNPGGLLSDLIISITCSVRKVAITVVALGSFSMRNQPKNACAVVRLSGLSDAFIFIVWPLECSLTH